MNRAAYATTPMVACMGGWCVHRDACGRFHQPEHRGQPAERLCAPGVFPMFTPNRPRRDYYPLQQAA